VLLAVPPLGPPGCCWLSPQATAPGSGGQEGAGTGPEQHWLRGE